MPFNARDLWNHKKGFLPVFVSVKRDLELKIFFEEFVSSDLSLFYDVGSGPIIKMLKLARMSLEAKRSSGRISSLRGISETYSKIAPIKVKCPITAS